MYEYIIGHTRMLGAKEDIESSRQGPILELLYPWYNTKQNSRKDYVNAHVQTKTFNLLYT